MRSLPFPDHLDGSANLITWWRLHWEDDTPERCQRVTHRETPRPAPRPLWSIEVVEPGEVAGGEVGG